MLKDTLTIPQKLQLSKFALNIKTVDREFLEETAASLLESYLLCKNELDRTLNIQNESIENLRQILSASSGENDGA